MVLIALGCGGALGLGGAVKVYVIWIAVALAGCAVVQQARRARARRIAAAAVAAVLLALAAGPFWANGVILAVDPPWRARLASSAAGASGMYATVGCMEDTGFVWTEAPILYQHTVLGRDVQFAPPAWYATVAGFAILAALLIARVALARRRAE